MEGGQISASDNGGYPVKYLALRMVAESRICQTRVDEDGNLSFQGRYQLTQFFSPRIEDMLHGWARKRWRYNLEIEGVTCKLYLAENIRSAINSTFMLLHQQNGQLGDEELVQHCIDSIQVRSMVENRVKYLRIHLLWQPLIIAFKSTILNSGVGHAELMPLLRTFAVEGEGGEVVLLEDLLLNETSYGRMLKECRFGDALQILQEYESEMIRKEPDGMWCAPLKKRTKDYAENLHSLEVRVGVDISDVAHLSPEIMNFANIVDTF